VAIPSWRDCQIELDSLADRNRLQHLYPEQKLSVAFVGLSLALVGQPLTQLLVLLWMAVWTIGYAKIPAKTYFAVVLVPTTFVLTSVPALVANWSSSRDVVAASDIWAGWDVGRGYLYLSHHGFEMAALAVARSISSTSCLAFVLCTVPFVELVCVMQRLKLPDFLAELLFLTYRFIFLLLETAKDLREAQQARLGYGTWRNSLRSVSLLVGQLFLKTIDRYRQFSLSLESRGSTGTFRVWSPRRYRFSKRYSIELVVFVLVVIFLEFWMR